MKRGTENHESQELGHTFEYIANEWLAQKKSAVKSSTYIKYRNLLSNIILPEFGSLRANEFSAFRFEQGLIIISQKNEVQYSKSTMKSILYLIRAIIKYGTRHSYNLNLDIVFEFRDSEERECEVLTPCEEKQILHELTRIVNKNNLGILLSLTTGMRIGEICALKREHIDFERKIIHICETAQRLQMETGTRLMSNPPKSKKSKRYVPLPYIVLDYMKEMNVPDIKPENYVLTGSFIPYEPRTLQYAFKAVLKKCKLEDRNFHSLRHTFATNCVELGFDIKTLSELLGHSSVNFTLNKYVHSSLSQKKKQMGLLDKKYQTLFVE
ncbi:MAG: site-specific integrase [Blautia sp.]|nr:site-specific integrase [Blautia sp.]